MAWSIIFLYLLPFYIVDIDEKSPSEDDREAENFLRNNQVCVRYLMHTLAPNTLLSSLERLQ